MTSDRVDKILNHKLTKQYYDIIHDKEKERVFCKHGFTHVKETARIALILNQNMKLGIHEDIVCATAILHDIGKSQCTDIEHAITGAKLAVPILKDCGFDDYETGVIYKAIENHSNRQLKVMDVCPEGEIPLVYIISRADSLSRECYKCPVNKQCNWEEPRKNKARYNG